MKQNLTTGNPYRNTPHYEYPQDIPDCHRDIVEELRTKAQDVRSIHIKKPSSGNAAVAKLELAMGIVYSKEATSKKKPLNIPGEDNGPKGLAIKYNPSYPRRVGNKKSDISGCDFCNGDTRNDLE